MKKTILVLAALLTAGTALAHGVDHRVVPNDSARIVEIFTSDGRPFSYESFEITGPGDASAFQIGRTDRLGRIAFVPDRTGSWSIRVWSEDGHGLTVELDVTELAAPGAETVFPDAAGQRRLTGVIVGVALILVVGGALYYFQRKKGQS